MARLRQWALMTAAATSAVLALGPCSGLVFVSSLLASLRAPDGRPPVG
jgi:hypothetical protein